LLNPLLKLVAANYGIDAQIKDEKNPCEGRGWRQAQIAPCLWPADRKRRSNALVKQARYKN